uniref:Uncharacterized protein n=1 Tax=Acinetobacter lwoffii TaxID=28090 RepID=A0A385L172_ACILW
MVIITIPELDHYLIMENHRLGEQANSILNTFNIEDTP